MNDNKDLEKAIDELKNTKIADGPTQDFLEQTISRLSAEQRNTAITRKSGKFINLLKIAAAAVILLAAGYFLGWLNKPAKLNDVQFQELESAVKTSLEPVLRKELEANYAKEMQTALEASHSKLRDELQEQFYEELNKFAVETLNVSSTVTNQLITDLIVAIDAAQMRERNLIGSVLEQLELNRIQTDTEFQEELNLTKKGVATLLAYANLDDSIIEENKNVNINGKEQ